MAGKAFEFIPREYYFSGFSRPKITVNLDVCSSNGYLKDLTITEVEISNPRYYFGQIIFNHSINLCLNLSWAVN